jgi:hypothetical protein
MVSYRKSSSANTYKATWRGPTRETQKESVIRKWLDQNLPVVSRGKATRLMRKCRSVGPRVDCRKGLKLSARDAELATAVHLGRIRDESFHARTPVNALDGQLRWAYRTDFNFPLIRPTQR